MGHFAELFVFNDFSSISFRAVAAHETREPVGRLNSEKQASTASTVPRQASPGRRKFRLTESIPLNFRYAKDLLVATEMGRRNSGLRQ
jgi:hypothetical protein